MQIPAPSEKMSPQIVPRRPPIDQCTCQALNLLMRKVYRTKTSKQRTPPQNTNTGRSPHTRPSLPRNTNPHFINSNSVPFQITPRRHWGPPHNQANKKKKATQARKRLERFANLTSHPTPPLRRQYSEAVFDENTVSSVGLSFITLSRIPSHLSSPMTNSLLA
jgi:hypothetical protein